MKLKRLSALLLLLCILSALCACRHTPISDGAGDTTEGELQTAHVIGIRPADTPETEESFEPITETAETQSSVPSTVVSLPDFFLDEVNRKGKLIISPDVPIDAPIDAPIVPPGTPVDPAEVPESDRTALYGKAYRFRLTADEPSDHFYFQFNTKTKQLAAVVPCSNLPLLLIFQTDVENGAELVRMAREGEYLTATLLYARNLANDQLMYLGSAFSRIGDPPREPDTDAW
jgi:hypothetical protein